MEKRFILFIVLSMLLLTGHAMLRAWLWPAPPVVERPQQAIEPELEVAPQDAPAEADAADDRVTPEEALAAEVRPPEQPALEAEREHPQQWVMLGSYEGPQLAMFNSRGGALQRIELTERTRSGRFRYRNLDDESGYLGHVAGTLAPGGGCRVNVVGDGTPAALAVPENEGSPAGLQVGDVIVKIDDTLVTGPPELEAYLRETEPGDRVQLVVQREGSAEPVLLAVTLGVRPFQMIQPEALEPDEREPHPLSYLVSLTQVGDLEVEAVPALAAMRDANWEVRQFSEPAPGVEFRYRLDELPGIAGSIEVIKRFRLGTVEDLPGDAPIPPFHLMFELEIVNQTDQTHQIAYQLDGPNGLPLEGWWYSHKIHPEMFKGAGARDVLYDAQYGRAQLFGAPAIFKTAEKNQRNGRAATTALFDGDDDPAKRTLEFAAVDTQYFLAAARPVPGAEPPNYTFSRGEALALGDLERKERNRLRTVNTSFQLESEPLTVEAGAPVQRAFVLYSGPKQPGILDVYGLSEAIYYGWFGVVSRPLSVILHFFYSIVGNYGLAIIMLTVLVRSAMFPLSRKAAKNAAMMQELAPEMKKIAERYKSDMEKRAKAQQELFRKHNYNPLSGCWLMFLQLPIFLGLYRALSVDLELRQAPLIPGISWCSNLAGPDKLLYWENDFLGLFTETGMLGPYLNILPIVTIAMFLVHQKLFMPPATDDQTRMQLKMMKFMMIFMGVMFFKVASGLCLYFIASSLWGIAERKLLPKPKAAADTQAGGSKGGGAQGGGPKGDGGSKRPTPPRTKPPAGTGSNGSNSKRSGKPKKRAKRR